MRHGGGKAREDRAGKAAICNLVKEVFGAQLTVPRKRSLGRIEWERLSRARSSEEATRQPPVEKGRRGTKSASKAPSRREAYPTILWRPAVVLVGTKKRSTVGLNGVARPKVRLYEPIQSDGRHRGGTSSPAKAKMGCAPTTVHWQILSWLKEHQT